MRVVSPVVATISTDGTDDEEEEEEEFSEEVLEKEAAMVAKAYARSLLEQIREGESQRSSITQAGSWFLFATMNSDV